MFSSFFSSVKGREGRPAGEVWVWLSGLGVASGLLMVAALLAVIGVQGFAAFWPRKIDMWRLRGQDGAESVVYASEARERVRRVHAKDGSEREVPEVQLYLANREVYGQTYRYVDSGSVVSRERTGDVIQIARLENGPAIGKPAWVETADGRRVDASDPAFGETLDSLIDQGARRRGELRRVERGAIAEINETIGSLRRDARVLEAEGCSADEKEQCQRKIAELERDYTAQAARAAALRRELERAPLAWMTADGAIHLVPTGKIMSYFAPNRLGFFGQCGVFLQRFWSFCVDDPREANTDGGIFPAIFGTFVMTLLMSALVTPLGVVAAIYLREYAADNAFVRLIRICVNNLAGVPSIVFGVFGLGFFVYVLGSSIDRMFFFDKLRFDNAPTFGTPGILWAALTLALMTLPVVIVATEEALATVPRGLREAALACGASKWQTIQRVILPGALPGVLTGLILAMARGAGEVAPLMLTGAVKLAPSLPIDWSAPFLHLERKFMHMGFHIYDVGFQSPDSDAAEPMVFATTLLLIALVVAMNAAAINLRNRLRRRHRTNSF